MSPPSLGTQTPPSSTAGVYGHLPTSCSATWRMPVTTGAAVVVVAWLVEGVPWVTLVSEASSEVAVSSVDVVDPDAPSPSPPPPPVATMIPITATATRPARTAARIRRRRVGSSSPFVAGVVPPIPPVPPLVRRDPPSTAAGAVPSRPAAIAAPSDTACLGWLSTLTGRPVAFATSSPTRGMRELPPTSSVAVRSLGSMPALAMARIRAWTVWSSMGRISRSNSPRVRRTWVLWAGSSTGMSVDSWVERSSLAATRSRFSWASALATAGSLASSSPVDGCSSRTT